MSKLTPLVRCKVSFYCRLPKINFRNSKSDTVDGVFEAAFKNFLLDFIYINAGVVKAILGGVDEIQ